MAHYVLMFRGSDPRQADLDLIEQSADVTILDRGTSRALLVDAPEEAVQALREHLQDWVVAAEVSHPPPGPARQSVVEDPQDPQ
jgi:hypothetical protein